MSSSVGYGSELEPEDTALIKEVYDSENAQEIFEIELERALQVGCRAIVIEPTKLAEETSRWITTGRYLHRITIISGFGAIVTGLYFWDKPLAGFPLGFTSAMCASLYMSAWQFDPCVKYRVGDIQKGSLSSHSSIRTKSSGGQIGGAMAAQMSGPILLVRKRKQTAQVVFHTGVAVAAFSFCIWRLWSDE